jgi:hypothetical protein
MKRWVFPALLVVLMVAGCKSAHVDALVQNRTGESISLVEVDYPSASFGLDGMENGTDYSYRFQIRGSGKLSVQYTEGATGKVHKIAGPEIREGDQGQVLIVLTPDGKAKFTPQLRQLQ